MAKLEEIFKQKVSKTIEKETVHKFSLDEERFYLWLVLVKAQAWWQRLVRRSKKFWQDEEFPNWATDKHYKTKIGTIYFYELGR